MNEEDRERLRRYIATRAYETMRNNQERTQFQINLESFQFNGITIKEGLEIDIWNPLGNACFTKDMVNNKEQMLCYFIPRNLKAEEINCRDWPVHKRTNSKAKKYHTTSQEGRGAKVYRISRGYRKLLET